MTDTAPASGTPDLPEDAFARLRDSLPEELRASPALSPYTSFEGLARSHVAAQRMIGKRIEDASPEELARFSARHGRPETPDGYEFPAGEEPPAGHAPALEAEARRWFHEAGLSQRQAEVLYGKWNAFAAEQAGEAEHEMEEARAGAESALRAEWGRAYDRRVGAARRAVAEYGGADLAGFLEDTGLGNDPRLVKAFARIAAELAEDGLAGGAEGEFAMAPDAARAEIARVIASPAYFDARHPEHAATVERMRALFEAAYPEMPA